MVFQKQQPKQDGPVSNTKGHVSPIPGTKNGQKGGLLSQIHIVPVLIAIFLAFLIDYGIYRIFSVQTAVRTYAECLKAVGSMIQTSYPAVCSTKDGLRFTEEITPSPTAITKAEECYTQATNITCPVGAACMKVNPAIGFCACLGGLHETVEAGTDRQHDTCLINGEEYDGISFQDLQQGWYWGDQQDKKSGTPETWIVVDTGTRNAMWHTPESTPSTSPPLSDSVCAKAGERPVSALDMTTGKRDPTIAAKTCCPGLKSIADKQSTNISGVCSQITGKAYTLCSPCGNGVCDPLYEDACNCPEDCK